MFSTARMLPLILQEFSLLKEHCPDSVKLVVSETSQPLDNLNKVITKNLFQPELPFLEIE